MPGDKIEVLIRCREYVTWANIVDIVCLNAQLWAPDVWLLFMLSSRNLFCPLKGCRMAGLTETKNSRSNPSSAGGNSSFWSVADPSPENTESRHRML